MRELLDELLRRWEAGEAVALATVVATSSSAPRPPGAALLVGPDGEPVGSVSGGCVEGAVYETATEVLATGEPRLDHYGYSDATAFAVGLTCGGSLEVFTRTVDRETFPELPAVVEAVRSGRRVTVTTVIEHPELAGSHLVDSGPVEARTFVEVFEPAPRMIVFGAIDFAAAMAAAGKFLGYRVTVCDARATFATRARLPQADEVVVDWPHRYLRQQLDAGAIDARTVVCALTHDEKFDVPLLSLALRTPELAYVGAMGSRRTVADRMAQLSAEGLDPAELSRLHAPIGLDLGARTPAETAISIAAEILASRSGAAAARLTDGTGPIHARESISL